MPPQDKERIQPLLVTLTCHPAQAGVTREEVYYEELAHASMETEKKSCDLLSVSPRTRGLAGGTPEDKDVRTENWKEDWFKSQSKDRRLMSQLTSRQEANGVSSTFLHPFILLRPSKDWMVSTHAGRAVCFTEPTHSNADLLQTQTHSEIMLPLGTRWPRRLINEPLQLLWFNMP